MRNRYKDGFNTSLRIGLSETGITLLRTSGWFQKHSVVLADHAWSAEEFATPDRMAAQLRRLLTEFKCDRLPATIILSDALVRIWTVTPPQNAVRLSDCQAAARMRFQALYGEPMTDWELAADWNARHPFLACAMPRSLLQALQNVAQEHQLTLLEIVPQFIVAWNRWRADMSSTSWFGVLHDNVLTIGAINQQRLCAVRAAPMPADAWHDKGWLPQHLQREALRLNLTMPSELQLCGAIPGHWINQTAGSLRCTRLDAQQSADRAPIPGVAPARAAAQGVRQ